MAEALNTLVKNARECTELEFKRDNSASSNPESKKSDSDRTDKSFVESKLYKIAETARTFLLGSKYRYAVKVHLFPEVSMTKIEFNVNCLEITPIAVDNLGLTYDSTLNVNFLYVPDVFYTFSE